MKTLGQTNCVIFKLKLLKKNELNKYRGVSLTGIVSPIPFELIPAKNSTKIKREKELFMASPMLHDKKDCFFENETGTRRSEVHELNG